jgi:OmpA-OmpF porin, OOP family
MAGGGAPYARGHGRAPEYLSWHPELKRRKILWPTGGTPAEGLAETFKDQGQIMQKVLLSVAAAAALSFVSFAANAATHDGAFISVNGGQSNYDISHTQWQDKTDRAYGVTAGYRWVVDRPFAIGVEAGYVNLGKMTTRYDFSDDYYRDVYKFNQKGQSILVGANGKWDLPHGLSITARAGIAHSRVKFKGQEDLSPAIRGYDPYETSRTSTDNGIYAGLGFGYDFTPNFGLTLTYDHYSLKARDVLLDKRSVDVSVYGGALEFRF